MPDARKTPNNRRFAGIRRDRGTGFTERRGKSGGNSPLTMGCWNGDTLVMVVEFPIFQRGHRALVAFHRRHGRLATVTAMQPAGRFGALAAEADRVIDFREKLQGDDAWINGGFFVLSPRCATTLRTTAPPRKAPPSHGSRATISCAPGSTGGFWQPMDTLCDKNHLETLWSSGSAPRKT